MVEQQPFGNHLRVEKLECAVTSILSPHFSIIPIKPTLFASKTLQLLTYHSILRPGASKV